MSVEPALYTKLTGTAAVTALVSTRIYPNEAPRGETYPYITYSRVNTERPKHLTGTSRLTRTRIQLEAISDKYSDVKAVGEALRVALDAIGGVTWGSVRVQSSRVEDQGDEFETPKSDEDQLIHRESMDLSVWWEESPT